jgi:hypothetical protein
MRTTSRRGGTSLQLFLATTILAVTPSWVLAEEATGNVVWVDERHSALLLECIEDGCPTIPNAKTGETYTFLIPADLKPTTDALQEGQKVTVVYEETQDNAYRLVTVK